MIMLNDTEPERKRDRSNYDLRREYGAIIIFEYLEELGLSEWSIHLSRKFNDVRAYGDGAADIKRSKTANLLLGQHVGDGARTGSHVGVLHHLRVGILVKLMFAEA